MSIMLSDTYRAFVEAGAPEEIARAASEEIASHEKRLLRLEVMTFSILVGTIALIGKAYLL